MQAALEPRVRCLVADTLGVGIDELAPDVSLTDELAADSLAGDALRAGRGAQLEITVAEDASDAELAHVRAEFAWLAEQGLAVAIGRAERSEARRSSEAA